MSVAGPGSAGHTPHSSHARAPQPAPPPHPRPAPEPPQAAARPPAKHAVDLRV